MGKTKALEIQGNSNVGLYAYATDDYCLIGKGLTEEEVKVFETSLDVPVHEISIADSYQVGVYLNGNSKKLLVPPIANSVELEKLKELGIDYAVIHTNETALGNNLIVNENYFFYNPSLEPSAVEEIKEALGIDGSPLEIEDWEVVGSIAAVNSKGGLVQDEIPDEVVELLGDKLKIKLEKGTLNFGSRVISGCVVVNNNGMVVGRASAGIEITNADLAFGFLEGS